MLLRQDSIGRNRLAARNHLIANVRALVEVDCRLPLGHHVPDHFRVRGIAAASTSRAAHATTTHSGAAHSARTTHSGATLTGARATGGRHRRGVAAIRSARSTAESARTATTTAATPARTASTSTRTARTLARGVGQSKR
ncbi:hypothetical protein FRUB_08430 [Fimbriiglobus ruber]|uniref:Uncharacterized protein n=1 Tax=Fimbriiglobus ruber TaxID=1908690 RepID=A0A225DIC6_9BACT|nr:hypothetical protein FRUB_08430 [Fimbriiglobus ruber]